MDKESVLNLAKLARIELKDKEAEDLSSEFDTILDYVSDVKKTETSKNKSEINKEENPLHNVFREDTGAHATALYTKEILERAPSREGDYIKVKKIL